ncbi:MAG TPA: site-2 protease family protein [Bacteroidota bacterium]|nr:site-2 protease family protein [Bacteroidota bacterium]
MEPVYPSDPTTFSWQGQPPPPPRPWKSYLFHASLFLLTFITTTLAGVLWLLKDPFELSNFPAGFPYSLSLLAILTAHEFGHYFAARRYHIPTTLPYFIPMPPFLINLFGTMGAVIRIRGAIGTRKQLFDIGAAGPIAGLIVTLGVLALGMATLPPISYLYGIHPEYIGLSAIPNGGLTFGSSLFFRGFLRLFAHGRFIPPMNEIYHYPYLCVGWFGLFITAMNLIPVGQLDGGHILYSMVGRRQGLIAKICFGILILIGLVAFIPAFGSHIQLGTLGWLIFAVILFFVIKLNHPEIHDPEPLDSSRTFLGWILMALFILIFTPVPFYEISPAP